MEMSILAKDGYQIPDTVNTSFFLHPQSIELDLPPEYKVTSAKLFAVQQPGGGQWTDPQKNVTGAPIPDILVLGSSTSKTLDDQSRNNLVGKLLTYPYNVKEVSLDSLTGCSGKQYVLYMVIGSNAGVIDDGLTAWQQKAWTALYNAAQNQYYTQQQDYQSQLTALQEKINSVDTLTLRREENEQIMKGVLRWLLGPTFDFMPNDVQQLFRSQAPPDGNMDLQRGTTYISEAVNSCEATYDQNMQNISDGLKVTADGWCPMFKYQEMVKFINEAIEWENILYFLYSYFWDVPESWEFIRQIQHPDAIRQAFLRAGSARVVLTVRKGWEPAWIQFVEWGRNGEAFGQTLIPGHPYISIAQEIQLYDMTNYPGIPPANPGGGLLPDSGAYVATQCRAKLPKSSQSGAPVTLPVDSSDGFIVGYYAIIDDYTSGYVDKNKKFVTFQEQQKIVAVPDKTHITVQGLNHDHDGSSKPFPVTQGGEKGQLIAEWFEYTPTSGTDIKVTSNLATIS
jgi:hypothetical protein